MSGVSHCSHETCHRFPSHHIGIPILILVPTHFHFLSQTQTPRAGRTSSRDALAGLSPRPAPIGTHYHDHDTIISLRRLTRRLHCRYVIPKSPANMGAFPGRAHSPGSRLRHLRTCLSHHPPPTKSQLPTRQDIGQSGTESPALLQVKLHYPFGVNAWAGRLTKSAAFFWTCAPRRVTVQSWTTRVAVQATSCHVVKHAIERQCSPTSIPKERGTPSMANIALSKQLRH